MADHENENQNEEEMEEEILINQEEGEGEGQDFYAIEMQINDEPYLIVIGKTEENKIFLRLMNKEDQNKPFFHNEFSLEDLKNINPIFNGIESEDIAFQYLVSNLNDAEKDVKIIDEEKINFSIIITDEEEKLEFDFILIKSIDDGNGENEMEEEGIEEMINEVVDDINEETGENNEVSEQREKEKNIPIKKEEKEEKKDEKEEKEEKEEEKEEIVIKKGDKKEDEDDILKIINSLNENFNNQIDKQNQNLENMKKELTEQNNKKIKEIKDELNKKDNEIIELKNTINNLQQKLSEYENNKPLKSSNKKSELNNNIDTNKIMNEVKGNMKGFDNKISEIKNIIEKDKKEKENNINKLTEKINNIENKIPKNKIKENDNNKIIALENGLKSLDAKLNNFENMAILLEKQNDDNKVYEIINTLGEEMNEIKQKLNKKEKEKNLNNNKNKNKSDPEILNKIKNNENNISILQTKLNKIQEIKQKDNDDKKKINNIIKTSNDLVTKIDALFNHIKKLENENKELNNKITKLSSSKQIPQINAKKIIQKSNTNYYRTLENQNQENQSSFYNRTNPNINNINISKDSINSRIVNYEDIIFIQNRIKEINPRIKDVYFSLVYRATEDGDKAVNFHNKCDKIGPNIVLIKTKKGFIFGGFTFRNWEHLPRDIDVNRPNLGSASRDANAFGFNINNQKIYNNERPNEFAIWCNRNFGPTFKNNLFQIFDSCLKKGGYCTVRRSSHFGGQKTDFEITGGESKFKVDELEVFEVKLEC